MNIYTLQFGTMTQNLASFIALTAMAFLTYFPAMAMATISRNAYILEEESTKKALGELYEDTKIIENKTTNQFFMTLFLFRRLLYVLILVLLRSYPEV